MIVNDARDFLDQWDAKHPTEQVQIVLPVSHLTDDEIVARIKEVESLEHEFSGRYKTMLRTTAFGMEIVVIHERA